jgi:hypothetical protein
LRGLTLVDPVSGGWQDPKMPGALSAQQTTERKPVVIARQAARNKP